MSPVHPSLRFRMDIPMSPSSRGEVRHGYSYEPDQGSKVNMDVPMSPAVQEAVAVAQFSDPWDEELISSCSPKLPMPLPSQPNFITWQCKVPSIAPKMTIKMGEGSLRVDCILGQGAFATVYQATDLTTSEKRFLKVQKPANPVLLGELHNCGTLLNAVNLYKNLSDKVMPQPLVIYFTVCILHMVEQLHSIRIRALRHRQVYDFRLPVYRDAEWETMELPGRTTWNSWNGVLHDFWNIHASNTGGWCGKTNSVFRRNPHSDLWTEFFHTLLNVPDCSSLPCLRSLRSRLSTVLQQKYSKSCHREDPLVIKLLEK
ncbi:hypothetical protein J4Q44_G00318560 [Coregonus suidteri]|uniref:Protein kinase domain-containing protein n=1 Tax=Coregonus suidteri TaxID=861788 RepID=A0AAN8QHU8_9TELE